MLNLATNQAFTVSFPVCVLLHNPRLGVQDAKIGWDGFMCMESKTDRALAIYTDRALAKRKMLSQAAVLTILHNPDALLTVLESVKSRGVRQVTFDATRGINWASCFLIETVVAAVCRQTGQQWIANGSMN